VDSSYGLGWIIGSYKGQPLIEHGGNTLGFTSDLAFLPQANLGISVLANAQAATLFTQAVRYRLLELVFDQPSELDAQITFAHDAAQKATDELHQKLADQVDTLAVEPYLGRFANEVLGNMDVTLNSDNTALLADIGEFVAELRPQLNDEGGVENYVMYNPPLAGLAVKLAEGDDGNPIIVVGAGVVEYTFIKLE
jgi:plasmid stabilization system protein ParE